MSDWETLNKLRVTGGPYASDPSFGFNGLFVFNVRSTDGIPTQCHCIASDGGGWQHVSVKLATPNGTALPNWDFMCRIKELFWDDEDTVIQFHPAKSQYVNCHPHVLHLWRCIDGREQPIPPSIFVGPKG